MYCTLEDPRIVQLREDYGPSFGQFWNDVFAPPRCWTSRRTSAVPWANPLSQSQKIIRWLSMRVGVFLRRRRELAEADCKVPENGSRTNEHGGNRYRQ